MPGSAFDGSGPPNGDYARYLERLSDGDRDSGLASCPGPAPGFGYGATTRSGSIGSPETVSARNSPLAGEAGRRPRRALHVFALALILAGIAVIALAALPPEPWFSTPLPGFVLLIAGLQLRRIARRGHGRHAPPTSGMRPDRPDLPDRRDPNSGP